MLGELSGSLAHELNQPLTAILSNAQAAQRFLAHDDVDLDEVRDILRTSWTRTSARAKSSIVCACCSRRATVEQQPLDVNDVVQEVLKLMRSDLLNQSVTAHTELAPDLPTVKETGCNSSRSC